jgi:hypothetical protein
VIRWQLEKISAESKKKSDAAWYVATGLMFAGVVGAVGLVGNDIYKSIRVEKAEKARDAVIRAQLRIDETTRNPLSASCKQLEDAFRYDAQKEYTNDAQIVLRVHDDKGCKFQFTTDLKDLP